MMRAAGFARASWQSLSAALSRCIRAGVCDFCTDPHRAAGRAGFVFAREAVFGVVDPSFLKLRHLVSVV